MALPDFVTLADRQRWNKNMHAACAAYGATPAQIDSMLANEHLRDYTLYPGEWLGEQLRELGCEQPAISAICFLLGSSEPKRNAWQRAQKTLAYYKQAQIKVRLQEQVNQTN